jgi:uncharacterized protein YybS (DUF2232 family)
MDGSYLQWVEKTTQSESLILPNHTKHFLLMRPRLILVLHTILVFLEKNVGTTWKTRQPCNVDYENS